jgi:hypothetical protein
LIAGLAARHTCTPTRHALPLRLSIAVAMPGAAAGAFSISILFIPAAMLAWCTCVACATT